MKSTHKSSYLLISAFVMLIAGTAAYYFFNPHIALFQWLGFNNTPAFLNGHSAWLSFLRGHFADATWCAALCMVINYLSLNKYLVSADKYLLLSLPFIAEFGQCAGIVPGTFDWLDIATYLAVIIIYSHFSSLTLIPVRMKKIKSRLAATLVAVVFLFMVFASATQHQRRTVYRAPQKRPCVQHGPLNYSPVLIQVNIDGSYTMKDLPGVQTSWQSYFLDKLLAANSYKYKFAQGVTPNLTIQITINTDGYQHYGATVKFYVYDDNTWFTLPSNYVEPARLVDDIADRMNRYVSYGWSHDCP